MPQIPVYEGRTVREAPLGASPLGAAAFGGIEGKQLEQFGNAATRFGLGIGKAIQEKVEKEDDDSATLALEPVLTNWNKYLADAKANRVEGKAQNLIEDSNEWWTEAVANGGAGLSEGARRKFDEKISRFRIAGMGAAASHEATEIHKFKAAGIDAGVKSVLNNAAIDPTPEGIEAASAALRSYTRMALELSGKLSPGASDNDPMLTEAVRAQESGLHFAVLEKLLNQEGGAAKASEYLNRYGDRMTATARSKARDTVDAFVKDENGYQTALKLANSGADRTAMFGEIEKITDPGARDSVGKALESILARRDRAEAADNKAIVEKVWDYERQGKPAPKALVDQMPHDQWIQYTNFRRISAAAAASRGGLTPQGFARHTNYEMQDFLNNAFLRGDIRDVKDLDRFRPFLAESDFRAARATFASRQVLPVGQVNTLFDSYYKKPKKDWTDADYDTRTRFAEHMATWAMRTKTPEDADKEAGAYFRALGAAPKPGAKPGYDGNVIVVPADRRDDMTLALNAYMNATGRSLMLDPTQRRGEIEKGVDVFYTRFGREAYDWLARHQSPALRPGPFTFAAYAQLREQNKDINPQAVAAAAQIFQGKAARDADSVQATDATRWQAILEMDPSAVFEEQRRILALVYKEKRQPTALERKILNYNPDR